LHKYSYKLNSYIGRELKILSIVNKSTLYERHILLLEVLGIMLTAKIKNKVML